MKAEEARPALPAVWRGWCICLVPEMRLAPIYHPNQPWPAQYPVPLRHRPFWPSLYFGPAQPVVRRGPCEPRSALPSLSKPIPAHLNSFWHNTPQFQPDRRISWGRARRPHPRPLVGILAPERRLGDFTGAAGRRESGDWPPTRLTRSADRSRPNTADSRHRASAAGTELSRPAV